MLDQRCYNKGCRSLFNPEENSNSSCCYHPGHPVFHDGKKMWSCCKKYSTDFTDFLYMEGCTIGRHSNEVPKVKEHEKFVDKLCEVKKTSTTSNSDVPECNNLLRPSSKESLESLPVKLSPSLKSMIDKFDAVKFDLVEKVDNEKFNGSVEIGTNCKNGGCKEVYTGNNSSDLCVYHSGIAIFHEGMKFWTCCNQKTSDFEAFLNQAGCTTGRHNWFVEDAKATNLSLRMQNKQSCHFDWFQMSGNVCIAIYAKNIIPNSVSIQVNKVYVKVDMKYGLDDLKMFAHEFHLFGVIDPSHSYVQLTPTKAEIVLKKVGPVSWTKLECLPANSVESSEE